MRAAELVATLVLCLAACGGSEKQRDVDCLRFETNSTVGASYQSRSAGAARRWSYLRRGDEVAFEHADRGVVEVWKRMTSGEIVFERRFPAHRRSITYTSGELKSLGRDAPWETVSRVVPPDIRSALRESGDTRFRCLDAEVFRGELGGKRYELVWLPGPDLPARLVVTDGPRTHELVLRHFHSPAAVEQTLDRGREYDAMDFADIGDNETDPFVARLIHQGFVEHPAEHHGGH